MAAGADWLRQITYALKADDNVIALCVHLVTVVPASLLLQPVLLSVDVCCLYKTDGLVTDRMADVANTCPLEPIASTAIEAMTTTRSA